MRYLTCADYFKPSPNITLAGMSEESESEKLQECTKFIQQINSHLNQDAELLLMAVHIFCMFARKKSFVEFDRFLACGMAHFVAAKVAEKRPTVEFYTKFVHENRPATTKLVKGKTHKQKPYAEVRESLQSEAMSLELDLLSVLGFEFDFVLPTTFLRMYLAVA